MANYNTAQITDYIKQNYPGLTTDPGYVQNIMNTSGGGDYSKLAGAIAGTPQYQQMTLNNANNATTTAEKNFNTNLTGTINSLPSPTDTYNSLANTLGITGTQTALTSAENNLNTIPDQTKQLATSMGGISSEQMNARNAEKSSELSPIVSALANTLGIKNQQFGTLFAGQEQQNQNKLLPYQYQAQQISQNAQNTYNAWSTQEQQAFQTTYSQIAANEQLTNAQAMAAIQQANTLQLYGTPNASANPLTALASYFNNPATTQNGSSGGSGTGSGYTFG